MNPTLSKGACYLSLWIWWGWFYYYGWHFWILSWTLGQRTQMICGNQSCIKVGGVSFYGKVGYYAWAWNFWSRVLFNLIKQKMKLLPIYPLLYLWKVFKVFSSMLASIEGSLNILPRLILWCVTFFKKIKIQLWWWLCKVIQLPQQETSVGSHHYGPKLGLSFWLICDASGLEFGMVLGKWRTSFLFDILC